jgi:nucleotide-binding universal stress UspA family protein
VGLSSAVSRASELLDAAVAQVSATQPELAGQAWLARVRPHELVGEQLDADLLVLGGPRAGGPARLGLVAYRALQHAPCAVLLSPRPALA